MKARKFPKWLLVILIILLALLTLFLVLKHGWRSSIRFCTDPQDVWIRGAEMQDGEIHLKGNIMSSFEAYDGYITRYDGDVMYIGVKFRVFLYDPGNTMNFDISVPVDRPVSKIVLAGGTEGEQKELYPILEDEPVPEAGE